MSWKLAVLVLLLNVVIIRTLDNGLARTPPMGWMQWQRFRCNIDCVNDPHYCVSEKLIMQMADIMVTDGYKDAGYEYVSIDDCWMSKERDPKTNKMQADPVRFPSGIKALANYVHSKGLKLGIYQDMGTKTCKGYPGSQYYVPLDAQTFADWEVDMLKLDCCNTGYDMVSGYSVMGSFLNKTGRPILYACSWPVCMGKNANFKLAAKMCNMWRNAIDITDSWDRVHQIIKIYSNNTQHFAEVAGPGHWNDPDQLIIGDYGLSETQQKVQMGMWAMMASPLFMSVDLRNIDPRAKKLLLNKQVLAINQDPLGKQGMRVWIDTTGTLEYWTRPLMSNGSYAIAILNTSDYGMSRHINCTLKDFKLPSANSYLITDIFGGENLGKFGLSDRIVLQLHPTDMFLATAVPMSFS
ncbi:hypothetical protein KUTeg_024266 [Tegillarca granosa]|uniref:Alpha-galactosidase n=1 Tax=Tegillarca granosa TaxID=220873 RepID=A0ABQ9E2H8_TEGGR|nr:hypothetical protein KUTeg_024266 [Tegillarca granosa]